MAWSIVFLGIKRKRILDKIKPCASYEVYDKETGGYMGIGYMSLDKKWIYCTIHPARQCWLPVISSQCNNHYYASMPGGATEISKEILRVVDQAVLELYLL